jgi:FtsH-binding integral membrane protein
MVRWFSMLLGPEGVWVLISLFAYIAAVWNRPATPAGNEFLEALWLWIPLVGIPLTFLTAYLPGGGSWWRLLRVVVASFFGVMIASFIAASGVDYHDSRNSGLLGAPFYSAAIGLLVLVPGALIAAIILFWRSRKGV